MALRLGSTTTRLMVLLFASTAIPALAMLAFMKLVSEQALRAEDTALVREVRGELLAGYHRAGRAGLRELKQDIDNRVEADPAGQFVFALVNAGGKVRAGSLGGVALPLPAQGWTTQQVTRPQDQHPVPVYLNITPLVLHDRLVVGHFDRGADAIAHANRRGMLLAGLLTLPLALGLTLLLLYLVDRRVSRIAGIASQVGAGELSNRVPSDGSGDSFDRLSTALNRMLAQVETLIGELRLVTDGLAHDLRSPVTRLQAALDRVAMARDVSEADALLGVAREEAAKLQTMLTTALQVTRAEAGIGRDRFEDVAVGEMLEDVAEIYGPLAEDRGLAITTAAPAGLVVRMHRELVGQALGNLIDNALRYAEGATRIDLAASLVPEGLVLEIGDDGSGIPADRREEALRRFGRLDPARNAAGSGLGLSLVSATARLHYGHVELADPPGGPGTGLVVRMVLARNA